MISLLLTNLWFPVILLIAQTLMFSFVASLALRWMGILRKPYNGMDYGMMLYAASLMLGMIVIASADADSLFQSAKVYLDKEPDPFKSMLTQFTKLFLVVLITGILFLAMNYACFKWIAKGKLDELEIPSSLILTSIALGNILVGWLIAKEYTSLITPQLLGLAI